MIESNVIPRQQNPIESYMNGVDTVTGFCMRLSEAIQLYSRHTFHQYFDFEKVSNDWSAAVL